MDTPKSQTGPDLVRRVPITTLLVIGAAAAIARIPGSSRWLVYDRHAILSGQVWRMFTGHWVHFSMSHLVYDSLVFGIAGWMIETKRLSNFGWLCLLAPWLISGLLLVFQPRMEWFGGLSALATAAVVYLALSGLRDGGLWRWACFATLAGIAVKIIFEATTGRMIFATIANTTTEVLPAGHFCGALIALLFYGWARLRITTPTLRRVRPARRFGAERAWRRCETVARP